jgi:hypothetical protein
VHERAVEVEGRGSTATRSAVQVHERAVQAEGCQQLLASGHVLAVYVHESGSKQARKRQFKCKKEAVQPHDQQSILKKL